MRLMHLVAVLGALVVAAGLCACTASDGCPDSGARIYMSTDGNVQLQGKAVSVADLARELQQLKPGLTEICYSREDPQGEPPPGMTNVLDAIAAQRLPVSFYTDSSFLQRVRLQ